MYFLCLSIKLLYYNNSTELIIHKTVFFFITATFPWLLKWSLLYIIVPGHCACASGSLRGEIPPLKETLLYQGPDNLLFIGSGTVAVQPRKQRDLQLSGSKEKAKWRREFWFFALLIIFLCAKPPPPPLFPPPPLSIFSHRSPHWAYYD